MSFCASLLCCVNTLSNNTTLYDDSTLVMSDYNGIRDTFRQMDLSTTDDFWSSGAVRSVSKDSFKAVLVDFFNKTWYPFALNRALKEQKMSKVLYYSGHGVPDPGDHKFSPVPIIDFDKLVKAESVFVKRGDWPLHHAGFLGLKCLVDTQTNGLNDMEDGCDKELLIIADSCFAGQWCLELSSFLPATRLPNNCHISIQAATSEDQCAHAGIFTPTLCALQNQNSRDGWLNDFRSFDFKELKSVYSDYMKLQSPVFYSTRERADDNQEIACVTNLDGNENNKVFYLFRCPVFFWFCVDRCNLIDVIDEYDWKLWKKNVRLSEAKSLKLLNQLNSIIVNSLELKRYRGAFDKGKRTCENTYMPILRLDSLCSEIHTHYNESSGGPKTIGAITFKQLVTRSGKKDVIVVITDKIQSNCTTAIEGLMAQAVEKLPALSHWMSDDKLYTNVTIPRTFSWDDLKQADTKRKAFQWPNVPGTV